jgi:tripartite-type tricarboxylate transporter receptor subunit TctC
LRHPDQTTEIEEKTMTMTMAEAGYPSIEASEWYGLVAPAGTPNDIVVLLGNEIAKALNAPDVRDLLTSKGYEPASHSNPEQFGAFVASEHKNWALAVKQLWFRPE